MNGPGKLERWRWWWLGVLGLCSCSQTLTPEMVSSSPRPAPSDGLLASYSDRLPDPDGTLAVVGDTQLRSGWGRLLGAEDNVAAQRELFQSLYGAQPDALVMLGDIGFTGDGQEAHAHFDQLVGPLTERGEGVLPVLGNHDCPHRKHCGPGWSRRFAALRGPDGFLNSWYARIWGRLGLIWLDTKRHQIGDRAWQAERQWYARQLDDFGKNTDLVGVLVFMHAPPFTNGRLTQKDRESVYEAFVPDFCRNRKTLAMFSGHVHGYERFTCGMPRCPEGATRQGGDGEPHACAGGRPRGLHRAAASSHRCRGYPRERAQARKYAILRNEASTASHRGDILERWRWRFRSQATNGSLPVPPCILLHPKNANDA